MRPYCSPEGRGTRTAGCTVALPASSLASPTSQMWSASKSEGNILISKYTHRLLQLSFTMLTVDTLAPRQLEQLRGTVRDDVSNMVDSQQKFSSRTQREMGETKKMVKKVEGMTKKVELLLFP